MSDIIIKEYEINKTNISKFTTNKKRCYILGIGWTDYTIHKEANDLKHYYGGAGGFFKDFSIKAMNYYHVTTYIMRTLVEDSKFKKTVTLNKTVYEIVDAYYGLHDRIKLYVPHVSRGYSSMKWEGENLHELEEKIKLVVHLKELK